jgi:hypothetical protein
MRQMTMTIEVRTGSRSMSPAKQALFVRAEEIASRLVGDLDTVPLRKWLVSEARGSEANEGIRRSRAEASHAACDMIAGGPPWCDVTGECDRAWVRCGVRLLARTLRHGGRGSIAAPVRTLADVTLAEHPVGR